MDPAEIRRLFQAKPGLPGADEIRRLFSDPITGLIGLHAFSRKNNIPIEQVRQALQGSDVYTLNVPAITRFPRRKTLVSGPGIQYQADLVDFSLQLAANQGFKYILIVIDCFSRFVWAEPLKSKSGKDVTYAMAKILERSPIPRLLQTDNGTEFYNSQMEKLLDNYGIKLFSTYSDLKAAIAERFNRTLRMRLTKLWDATGSFNWVDQLQNVIYGYNHTINRSIKMTPVEASDPANTFRVYHTLNPEVETPDLPTLNTGQYVRIQTQRSVFTKRSQVNPWSTEIFQIYDFRLTHPVTYYLKDLAGEEIKGGFYRQELQPVQKPETFAVDKVLKERTTTRNGRRIKQLYVSWMGYPESFNSWVDEDDII